LANGGWDESAAAWIWIMGEHGDFPRRFVLDAPMLERVTLSLGRSALDVGCGEGRFCRTLSDRGINTVGLDPAPTLIEEARRRHPGGDYRIGSAEELPFQDESFDLVISYLSLIDIPDVKAALQEMTRVLRPGGHLLIANLTSMWSASNPEPWRTDSEGNSYFGLRDYMTERVDWIGGGPWRVQSWHRPLTTYMSLLLRAGLTLRHFDEPMPYGGEVADAERMQKAPPFLIMDWEKVSDGPMSPPKLP